MTVPGCDHDPPCPDPEAHEAILLAEVRNRIAGTGAISGTGSGADARYRVAGAWMDHRQAMEAGRLPDGEDKPGETASGRPASPVPADVLAEAIRRAAGAQAALPDEPEYSDDE